MNIDENRLRLFAQDEYYVRSWYALNRGESRIICFNPFAFLFGTTWCFYRKLYVLGIVYFFGNIAAATAGYMAYALYTHGYMPDTAFSEKMVPLLSIFLLARLPLSLISDTVYYRKAVKVINSYEADPALSEGDRAFLIESAGGTSMGGLILAIILSVLFRVFESNIESQPDSQPLSNDAVMSSSYSSDMSAFLLKAQEELPLTDTCPADVMKNRRLPGKNGGYNAQYCLDNENGCFSECLNGNALSCYNLAIHIHRADQADSDTVSEALFLAACKLGSMSGCTNRAAGMEYRSDTPAIQQCAIKTYEKTCAYGDAWGCTMYGAGLMQNSDTSKDHDRILALFKEACRLGGEDDAACISARKRTQQLQASNDKT